MLDLYVRQGWNISYQEFIMQLP